MNYDKDINEEDEEKNRENSAGNVYKSIFDEEGKPVANGGMNEVFDDPDDKDKVIKIPKMKRFRNSESNNDRLEYERDLSKTQNKFSKWRNKHHAKANQYTKNGINYYGLIHQKKMKCDLSDFIKKILPTFTYEELLKFVSYFPRQLMKQDASLKAAHVLRNDIKTKNILIEARIKDKNHSERIKYTLKLDDPDPQPQLQNLKYQETQDGLEYIGIKDKIMSAKINKMLEDWGLYVTI